MTRLSCSGPMLLRAVASAVSNLERHVEEVDALNVFPVPDGDTGSNMLATMRAALAAAEALPLGERSLAAVADALSRGALTGARGNSGVILSQIIRGMTVGADGGERATGVHLSVALRRAAEVAYGTVSDPVEGTILTVIRDAAEAAEAAAARGPHVEVVLTEAVQAAALSVARTPMLLPVLRDAGVVDSGGQGLYRLLQGTLLLEDALSASLSGAGIRMPILVEELGFGYETMWLLEADGADLDPEAIRADMEAMGESVLVAGDARAVRVHVHGERPDLVIGYGLSLGRLSSISVESLDRQVDAARERRAAQLTTGGAVSTTGDAGAASALGPEAPRPVRRQAVVAIATGEGLAQVLSSAGAAAIVRPAHGTRPSSGEIVAQILALGAREVILLPNDRDSRLAAEQASGMLPRVAVTVVPTRDPAEGIAALLAFDERRSGPENIEAMSRAAHAIHSFSISTAVRDAMLDGRAVRHGDALALRPDGGLLASDPDIVSATLGGLERLGAAFELVTLYTGESADPAMTARLREAIVSRFPGVEVEVLDGGQRLHHLLVAAE